MVLACSAWAESAVKINVKFLYKDFAGPVSLYEAKGQSRLWETRSATDLSAVPAGEPIAGASFQLVPGQRKRFVMVVRNTTDKPLYFFAAPHTVHPEEDALGFKFKCLCVNHAFTAGPNETWYRIVEFRLSQDFVGKELTITHTLIGIDKNRAASFSNEMSMPDM